MKIWKVLASIVFYLLTSATTTNFSPSNAKSVICTGAFKVLGSWPGYYQRKLSMWKRQMTLPGRPLFSHHIRFCLCLSTRFILPCCFMSGGIQLCKCPLAHWQKNDNTSATVHNTFAHACTHTYKSLYLPPQPATYLSILGLAWYCFCCEPSSLTDPAPISPSMG